jgi:hypothetical protein
MRKNLNTPHILALIRVLALAGLVLGAVVALARAFS